MTNRSRIYKALKIVIIALCIVFIGYKLWNETQNNNILEAYSNIKKRDFWIAILVPLLTLPNWGIEALKWQFIIKKIQVISYKNSIRATLTGITVAIFTPNRVGEFGGRILVLERKNRITGIFATLLGGYAQLLITLVLGIIAMPLYLKMFPSQLNFKINFPVVFFISIVVIGILLFVYLKIKFFVNILERIIKDKKKKRFYSFLKDYSSIELLKILTYSLFRYIVFVSQFFLLLKFFGVSVSYYQGFVSISVIYFIMTIIPIVSLFEFGVRGSVAILILSVYTPLSFAILSASLTLWILNLAIPSLIGSFLLYKYKI